MKKLLIVESPNKVRTIRKYLPDFEVLPTAGHFRDLPAKELGVDIATFTPTYVQDEKKSRFLANIKARAEAADQVFLGTDSDREGEAIAWHLQQVFRFRNAKRVRFEEITGPALQAALANAGPIQQDLVDAQQARRVLDRLVGYQVSPLLAVFGRGHSAGRVQSATLRLVVQRELEREAFRRVPFWVLRSHYGSGFAARSAELDQKGALCEARHASEALARDVMARAGGPHQVASLEAKKIERAPKAPFTTSTMQQAASVALGFAPETTMAAAQELFELGLISYHRSDSVHLSEQVVAMAREHLAKVFPEALPRVPPVYRGKSGAQNAHEAIRPTSLEQVDNSELSAEQRKLYALIRARFLASQCRPAVLERTTATIRSGDTSWLARGTIVCFESFLRFGAADEDSESDDGAGQDRPLPRLEVGQILPFERFELTREETKPPPRYTKATLIAAMDATGIGRPSTYAATVKLLFQREYLAEEKRRVYPPARGRVIAEALEKAFGGLFEPPYTAEMEARLDEVAAGKLKWKDELARWYPTFARMLEGAPTLFTSLPSASNAATQGLCTGRNCPLCSRPLLTRAGKKGPFVSCAGYPNCDFSSSVDARASAAPCPKCQGPMEEQLGKFGRFARCCRRTCGAIVDQAEMAPSVTCPLCSSPMKDRRAFYGCSAYPRCKGTLSRPVAGPPAARPSRKHKL